MTHATPSTTELKAAWRRAELWKRGISFDDAIAILYLRAAMIGAIKAQHRTAARHANSRTPYADHYMETT